jgi:non-specific serine/threonine protein kinase/serine/threonine-protein kinase
VSNPPHADEEPTEALPDSSPGHDRIGPYVLRHKIGEGGMGEVWLAEQREPIRREVALKIIKQGMDTKQVVARFEAERQALAMMDHPAIARIYDAGATPMGRPYFVMEYVKGVPITEHCDRHHLNTRERLELLLSVCEGVQHAHQKAVIHRDLKPSNVLVTIGDGKAQPKIIDFGVAKATGASLTDETMLTELGMMIGTPAYMSPEQAERTGQDIDTRTDVYSLGVVLYELLVGALPFDVVELRRSGYAAMVRKLREEEPPRPSTRVSKADESSTQAAKLRRTEVGTLAREIAGDLDWITMKALEKDRARRYESASALAADIRRFLRDEPVEARPPSTSYRLRKMIHRHRGAFVAAVSIFVALLLGIAGTTYGLLRAVKAEAVARGERDEARRQADIATAVNDFLNVDLLSAGRPSGRQGEGRDVSMREVLDRASERIDEAGARGGKFADKPSVEAAVRETLGETYRALGDLETSASHLERALELRERSGEDPSSLAGALDFLAFVRVQQGDYEAAESLYRRAIEIETAAASGDSERALGSKAGLGLALRELGRFEEAEAMFVDVWERQKRTVGDEHSDTLITMSNLANLYQTTERFEEAETLDRAILEIRRKRWGEDDPSTLSTLSNLANVVASAGRLDEAAVLMQEVLASKRRILGPEHPNTLNTMNNIGEVYALRGNWAEAERWHRETLALREKVLGDLHPLTTISRSTLGFTLAMQGRFQEGQAYEQRAVRESRDDRGPEHFATMESENRLAICLLGLGLFRESAAIHRRVAEFMKDADSEELYAQSRAYLGIAEARLGHDGEADAIFREAVPLLPTWNAETLTIVAQVMEIAEGWNAATPSVESAQALAQYRDVLTRAEAEIAK